jgi:acyl-CoA thioesterase
MNKQMKEFIEDNDQFARHSAVKLLEVNKGSATAEMEIKPFHLNAPGTVHGAALFTLADLALAAASNSQGRQALSIQASMNFFQAVREGKLTARAVEIKKHPKLATYRVEIRNEKDELIADFESTVYRKKEKFPPEIK